MIVYQSLGLVAFGMMMCLWSGLRLRSTAAEGLHEYYGGQLRKVSRLEQPRGYWARVVMMLSTGSAGIVFLLDGIAQIHR